ncbi:SusD/RagB family nutrient-binding outer membrane lipoprotein [Olivibacter sp. SDN3]|uniref:SusD/RagB family nutrient-binding outer membrane lipoprotein n=1 Tax=Olivibacter sp. SDN3 TaxID=2764720 RepID=UPI0021085A06|nr:SusD/RagB family nutrient-binding outer membrane lipoprotein [Olivibacter sp. SDN3]
MNKNIYVSLFVCCFISMQSCQKYFDLDDNPNLVQEPPLEAMLATVTQKTGLNSQLFSNFISYYTQYLASPSANGVSDTYQISDNSLAWNEAYYALSDLFDMKNRAMEVGATEYAGVANILSAYHIALIADTWGSAPYTEAFFIEEITLNPQYDDEEFLYNVQVQLLEEGIVLLKEAEDAEVYQLSASSDLIHAGVKELWLKTAYAMKARVLNKITKKSNYDAEAVLGAIDSSYTSNTDDAGMGTFLAANPWWQQADGNTRNLLNGWLSDNIIRHLNGAKYGVFDPRIEYITDRTVNDDYIGTRNGEGNRPVYDSNGNLMPNTVRDECYISMTSPLSSQQSPLYLVTFAEVKFIEAEAAFRVGDRERAYAAYIAGIEANMQKLGVTDATAYLTHSSVEVGASNLSLDLIFKEKYVVTYLNPEAWNDMRRNEYEYEDFQMPVNAALSTFIRQVAYPQDEINSNGANVPDQVSLDTHLWWDQP